MIMSSASTVLVLDDALRELEVEIPLASGRARLLAVPDEAYALELLRTGPSIKGVIVDVREMGGTTIAQIHEVRPDVAVIVSSDDRFDAAEAYLAGARTFLEKPADVADLKRVLDAVL